MRDKEGGRKDRENKREGAKRERERKERKEGGERGQDMVVSETTKK